MGDKVSDLVIRVKEYLSLSSNESDDSIREIENQIDDKSMEIRNIFSQNLDSVIEHYVKYH